MTFLYAYAAINAIPLIIAAVVLIRRKLYLRKCMSFVRRGADGQLYAIDPQTGTAHRLFFSAVDGSVSLAPRLTKADRKKAKRLMRRIMEC